MRACIVAMLCAWWPCTCPGLELVPSDAPAGRDRLVVLYNGGLYVIVADAARPVAAPVGSVTPRSKCVSVASSGRILTWDPYEDATALGWKAGGLELRSLSPRPGVRMIRSPTLSPCGKFVSFTGWVRDGDRCMLYVESMGCGTVEPIGRKWYDAQAPSWSPDGRQLAYYASDERGDRVKPRRFRLCVYDCETRTESEAAPPAEGIDFLGNWRPSPVWAADGKRVFFAAGYRKEFCVSTYAVPWPARGAPVLMCKHMVSSVFEQYAFGIGDEGHMCKWDMLQDPLKQIVIRARHEGDGLSGPAVSPSGRFLAFNSHRDGFKVLDLMKDTVVYENRTWIMCPVPNPAVYAWVPVAPAPESTPPANAEK